MRGYKGFDPELKCRDFPYEVGQSYSHDGPIGLCQQGFHFCEKLRDCFEFYDPNKGNRFCEVDARVDIQTDETKSVAKWIKIIRELTPVEINRAKYGNGNGYDYGDGYDYGYGYGYGINEILLYMEEEKHEH